MTNTIKVYAASLDAYNNGRLVGGWIDLSDGMDAEEIEEAIKKVTNGAEEYAIHDHDGLKPFYTEYLGPDDLAEISEAFLECDRRGIDWDIFCKWCSDTSYGVDDYDIFEDTFLGIYDRFEDYAEEFFDEVYLNEVPENVRYYIDYDAFARDLAMDMTVIDLGRHGVVVFHSH